MYIYNSIYIYSIYIYIPYIYDPATALSRCNELIEYLLRRGHGRRHTQLEVQRAMDTYRNPQQHIRKIDRAVYFAVQYHPCLPDIKGTLKNFLPIL